MHNFFILISALSMMSAQNQNTNVSLSEQDRLKLIKELEQIRMKDQTLRLILPEVEAKFGLDSKEVRYFWTLIHQQDRINEKSVSKIIDTYGWLGKSTIGVSGNQTLWLVIQHAPLEIQEKYLSQLETSVNQKESDGWYLAFLQDRILVRNGKKQKYGTQAKKDIKTGKTYFYEISDLKTVNQRRKAIGLQTIEVYAKQNNYLFKR